MSKKGQYLRGEKWFLMNRDADGVLKKEVKEDKAKMVDVNFYLDAQVKEVIVVKPKSKGKK